MASKAHHFAKGLVGGCALLLGVSLAGCAAPQFTYVANSGLIVAPEFRKSGLAKKIKKKIIFYTRFKKQKFKNYQCDFS